MIVASLLLDYNYSYLEERSRERASFTSSLQAIRASIASCAENPISFNEEIRESSYSATSSPSILLVEPTLDVVEDFVCLELNTVGLRIFGSGSAVAIRSNSLSFS
jgi:hypothetical protein